MNIERYCGAACGSRECRGRRGAAGPPAKVSLVSELGRDGHDTDGAKMVWAALEKLKAAIRDRLLAEVPD
jgi:hypothetical protein